MLSPPVGAEEALLAIKAKYRYRLIMIFQSRMEDFFKIFAATLLIFLLTLSTNILSSSIFILVTIYFLDGGHVYSTLLEVLADPEEIKKRYVWLVLLGSFFLNLFIHLFFNSYFFYYLFYFTIFHNMRQGLGVTFLYRKGVKTSPSMVKWSYYFLTMVPFILFHLRPPMTEGILGEAILRPVELTNFFNADTLASFFHYGLFFYLAGSLAIAVILFFYKNTRGLFSLIFFTLVYAYSFILSPSQLRSYALLIFSHAIPYFFLMEKRILLTHKVAFIKKYAFVFLVLLFGVGAFFDYYQSDLVDFFDPLDSLALALLTTPLIAHFIFDGIIWKRGNERFSIFLLNKPN